MNNKIFVVVILILLIASIVSITSYFPSKSGSKKEIQMADFPREVGEWISEDIPLSKLDYAILETDNLIMRNYKNLKVDIINLYIIYSQDNRKVGHPPEICLQGAGATVINKSAINITNSIKATELIIENNASKELVVYWYKVGKINTNSYLKQQLRQVIDKIMGKNSPIALIRVLTVIKNNDSEAALDKVKAFCRVIEPLLNKYVP